jgi:RteC protein
LDKLYRDLGEELNRIEDEERELISIAEKSIGVLKHSVEQLRNFVGENPFQTEEEEIYFFKFIKPRFFSKLVYYTKLLDIEIRRPAGEKKLQSRFFKKELKWINRFTEQNREFYMYYKSGAVHLDKSYFLRVSQYNYYSIDCFLFNRDPQFSSSQDLRLATILANESLRIFLTLAIEEGRPKLGKGVERGGGKVVPELNWSDSKTDLIELIYALQSRGSINHAAIEVKQLAEKFENIFNIDLGNYYKTFQEIRIRKKGRTVFLDQLREKLIQRMDESDENGRGI